MGNNYMGEHKRIVVITDNLRDQINGVSITFKHLAAECKYDGYEMHFIDPSEFYHISFPWYKEVKLALPFRVGTKISKLSPYYIHIATEGPIGLAAKLYCDRNKLNYNTSYHTKFPEYLYTLFKIPTAITYRYMRWFHKHSGIVLTTTKSMKETLLSNGFKKNIIEWTRGVDSSNFIGLHRNLTNRCVLFVGRVSQEKNLEELLALQDYYRIVIVGDGPDKKYLEEKYTKATFVGYKTGKELFQYYLDADVFCFPSKTDTFGIVLIEALAAGTPIAAYPVTGPLDIVANGINGYLDNNLKYAIDKSLKLGKLKPTDAWTWKKCWTIFRDNLIKKGA
jgi:glycosyltransferase involved in cell wall biosynthesis